MTRHRGLRSCHLHDRPPTLIYTLSLHDALPISLGLSISRTIIEAHGGRIWVESGQTGTKFVFTLPVQARTESAPPPQDDKPDRKSTRLNSSHGYISYAVFCLKKKTKKKTPTIPQ